MGYPKWTGASIAGLSLHMRASRFRRLDVSPFIALYLLNFLTIAFYRLSKFFAIALTVTIIILHTLALLAQQWSVRIKAFMSWVSVNEVRNENVARAKVYALCRPREHRGKSELVPLQIDDRARVFFVFQKRTYEYDADSQTFTKVIYPTNYPLTHYATHARSSNGLSNDQLVHAVTRYGANKLDMPVPTFSELFKQALMAPFFVFQVFCIFLWLLDEYWKYSLLVLVMMLVFEATVVHGRLRSLRELRGMRNPAMNVYAYRNKKWLQITSLELLPGDIVSICRGRDSSQVVPCDLLLLSGTAVVNEAMLTGESVPTMKESVSGLDENDLSKSLSIESTHKSQVLFGGTRILTHSPSAVTQYTPSTRSPDGGCVCYVLRTGFGSAQGKLMRTILFSTESVSANSKEAALFILFLLIFAIAASGYVIWHRYTDEPQGRYKLLLRCILIITSVVPPELPMQTALAVNTSLIALVKNMIFCTEPYRIPFAGKVDICCFDKTGTLTTDSINAVGVVMPKTVEGEISSPEVSGENNDIIPVRDSSQDAALVLAACHSLVHVDQDLVGDPLELAALDGVQWRFSRGDMCVPKRGGSSEVSAKILKRFRFASALQRMSVIVDINSKSSYNGPRVLVKGSPEAIGKLLVDGISDGYKRTAHRLARAGLRVLALAYKDLGTEQTISQNTKITRDDAEKDLEFAGFVCFECPLRSDSRKVVRMLKRSDHIVTMITGDATLTAAHVATQVGMCTRRILILDFSEVNPGDLEWFSASSGKRLKRFALESIGTLAKEFDLCVSGPALQSAMATKAGMREKLKHIKVFARMSPEQKESVLTSLKDSGFITLMCGDGTNDVGALKQAHVGVALLSSLSNPVREEKSQAGVNDRGLQNGYAGAQGDMKTTRNAELRHRKKASRANSGRQEATPRRKTPARAGNDLHADEYSKKMQELTEGLGQSEDQPPLVKLGDASIASPFTSRKMTIDSCVSIIRQGRCTLATTLQMYQILALNCLISAYSLSVLYLEGVMLGDKQMTVTGLVLGVASLMVSRSKPLKRLSPERPAASVFTPVLFLSMMGQFAIHVAALIMCVQLVEPYLAPDRVIDLTEEFTPNLLNSAVFLLSVAQQISVYVLNYKGRPHMQGIYENRPLLNSLLAAGGVLVICTLEVSLDLNGFMELVPWPSAEFQKHLGGIIVFDLVGSFVVDRAFTFLLSRRVKSVT